VISCKSVSVTGTGYSAITLSHAKSTNYPL
jgi:hypothetical protein